MLKDDEFVEQLQTDYTQAGLSNADHAMLDYAVKLTLTPSEITPSDIEALRDVGFDDRAILDIAQIVAYYAYVNRIADGLGVSLEDFWDENGRLKTE